MPRFKKEVGLIGILSAGIGVILGAGIYALIGKAALFAGNALWLPFLLASIIAAFTGLSYAELSSKFPKAGGEYVYVSKIMNKKLAILVGFGLILTGIFSSATLGLAFGGYLKSIFSIPILLVGMLLIAFVALLNYLGIKLSIKFNIMA
ncbi:amino acid permease, partial [Candidatus Woesearchaeota archaeon]|nr:amino acid permease [Candidatus Woesearchaeota archaeon]